MKLLKPKNDESVKMLASQEQEFSQMLYLKQYYKNILLDKCQKEDTT